MPVDAALSRTLAGRALAEAGQPERAVVELQHAAAELHACGAVVNYDIPKAEERGLKRGYWGDLFRPPPESDESDELSESQSGDESDETSEEESGGGGAVTPVRVWENPLAKR